VGVAAEELDRCIPVQRPDGGEEKRVLFGADIDVSEYDNQIDILVL
jgi:hypothetical protein